MDSVCFGESRRMYQTNDYEGMLAETVTIGQGYSGMNTGSPVVRFFLPKWP